MCQFSVLVFSADIKFCEDPSSSLPLISRTQTSPRHPGAPHTQAPVNTGDKIWKHCETQTDLMDSQCFEQVLTQSYHDENMLRVVMKILQPGYKVFWWLIIFHHQLIKIYSGAVLEPNCPHQQTNIRPKIATKIYSRAICLYWVSPGD